ncbi:hypothetical protein AMATHDRAFT_142020 [Amanita thiersii Skay4041]|uniref:RING-type domain-containing protein n=1 Tax=Amanita thiersii Skay4041 TaxID=703135 RepID=A0A2A9NTP3_9AGAR|nr:hypothetical protein AMATHDRAFT_142020 [Amanita thiersii Skay4041]
MEQDTHIPSNLHTLSLNLSYILNILPSSLIARIRRGHSRHSIDDFQTSLPVTVTSAVASLVEETGWSMQSDPTAPDIPRPEKVQQAAFPGPWAFFTSGYMLGLLLIGFLLHRMQNIIIPSRMPPRRRRDLHFLQTFNHENRTSRWQVSSYGYQLFVRRIHSAFLPLDMSKTTTRLALHIPSLCALTKMLFLWCLLIFQASDLLPSWSWAQRLGHWSEQKEMTDICWSTFCAVGSAFCVEAFIRALDGMGNTFGLGGSANPNSSPFNLIGYAFLLHIYSSPASHNLKPANLPSRPDIHVIITITIPLLQLTIFHYLSISKRLSSHRLIPTALTSFLSLTHFHLTIFSRFLLKVPTPSDIEPALVPTPVTITSSAPMPGPTSQGPTTIRGTGTSGLHSSYPLLNYIPNVFETILLSTILLTVSLNVIVQLLVRGQIERPFIGLRIANRSGMHDDRSSSGWLASLRNLPWDEDFGILLLRMSTASIEATGLRGWANEVASVTAPLPTPVNAQQPQDNQEVAYGRMRMGKMGVESISPGRLSTAVWSGAGSVVRRLPMRSRGKEAKEYRQPFKGYHNEVRSIDIGVNDASQRSPVSEEDGRGRRLSVERRWTRAFGMFIRAVWAAVRGFVMLVYLWLRALVRGRRDPFYQRLRGTEKEQEVDSQEDSADGLISDEPEPEYEADLDEDGLYAKFLQGEDVSDDDSTFSDNTDGASDSESGPSEDDEETALREEAMQLFSDLVDSQLDDEASMLFAHMVHPRTVGPLTRGRLESVVDFRRRKGWRDDREDDEVESLRKEMMYRKLGVMNEDDERERTRHLCVICTVDIREIICWPCRCLSMCDGCRDVLASRSAPAKHRCPCCRRNVEGYSRIYVP